MRRYRSLVENLIIAAFMLFALNLVIFPGLESSSLLVNLISLASFFILVVFAIASVPYGNTED